LDLSLARESSGGLSFGKTGQQLLSVKRTWLVNKKHKKKLKRLAKKKKDKATAQEVQAKIRKQVGMFEKLPEKCSMCHKVFPKTREAHMSWRVVVKGEKQSVWLFCPECQETVTRRTENNHDIIN
jgi:predicted RNA-binding Zn-ribbon protein involved in translation (DUF1610 family)